MTGFVFLDKEEGITSFIAAAKMRRIFSEKKAGHTGTLDPMATGVLPVAMGYSTRFIELIPSHDKAYRATFLLGKTTDTLDITGAVLSENEVTAKKSDVENVLNKFRGEISQLPPMYSAIKKNGVRLYELARQGIEIERESRQVKIYSLELVSSDEAKNEYTIDVECSSGTYIRSLISDIGDELSCGAVMTSLRRTKANGVSIDKCYTVEQLQKMKDEGRLSEALTRVDEFLTYPKLKVSAPQAKRFSNGGQLSYERLKNADFTDGEILRVKCKELFLGLGFADNERQQIGIKCVINQV